MSLTINCDYTDVVPAVLTAILDRNTEAIVFSSSGWLNCTKELVTFRFQVPMWGLRDSIRLASLDCINVHNIDYEFYPFSECFLLDVEVLLDYLGGDVC